ncbi:MAG: hypothetical protein COB50_03240, partial [Thiotrichales bacterium]
MSQLSICIPTYNRAEYLPMLLDSIIKQVKDHKLVEICISDNASTDNTKELINEYKKKYKNIKYYCSPNNMGVERNFLKVIDIAAGKYCWLMGSDDCLMDNSVLYILEKIAQHDVDIILSDVRYLASKSMKKMKKIFQCSTRSKYEEIFDLAKEADYVRYAASATSTDAFFGYMGNIIVKKASWNKVKLDKAALGSSYIQVYMLLSMIHINCCKMLVTLRPISIYRLYNDCFSKNGLAARILIDIKGYHLIGNLLFKNDFVRYVGLMHALQKEMEKLFFSMKRRASLNILADKESRKFLYYSCEFLFKKSFHKMHLRVLDVLCAFPPIKSLL